MARITVGSYRTIVGDVLQLQLEIPKVVNPESSNSAGTGSREIYACRIGNDGAVVLPIVGSFAAAGKSLAEIETGILAAYYPKYVKAPFPVYANILEYNTRTVSIAGAVVQPGVYGLRSDQMSLVSLLMKAGGIAQRGAAVIRIADADTSLPLGAPASARSWNTRRPELGPLEQTSILHEARITGGAEVQTDRITCRMVFEREGSLRTTGWLAVVDRGDVRVRKWLDIECEPQRSAFLHEVTAATGQTQTDRMREKLVRLARVLGSLPPGHRVDAAMQDCGWDAGDSSRVVTSLDTSPPKSQAGSKEVAATDKSAELVGRQAVATLALPVKGLNIPFADVSLEEGDSVVVEGSSEQFVSVLGLVRNAGNFPYPPDAQYNLAQAIGFAGGLDLVADPRYVSIYRLKPDGQVASVTVQLVNPKKKQVLTDTLAMPVRRGDIVSVEQTPRTRTNIFFDKVFRVSLGLYFNPDSVWSNSK